jgi:hypothetical protein
VSRARSTGALDLTKTMKKSVKAVGIIALALIILYPAVWIAASNGLFGDVEFGYYAEFNVAKHAIQNSNCTEVIEYSGVNKDVFLEEFHFKVTTKTGRVVRLWFDASNMDVHQVCYKPAGLALSSPGEAPYREYSIEVLSEILREKNIQVKNLKDVLCNVDELVELFEANYTNEEIPRTLYQDSWYYLRIEFPSKERLDDRKYTDIRKKDVTDWP